MSEANEHSLSSLKSINWWRDSAKAAVRSAPFFMLPAAGLTGANLIMLGGLDFIYRVLKSSEVTMEMLMQAAIVGFGSIAVGLGLTLWALGLWLLRLTAYARVQLHGASTSNVTTLAGALAEIRTRKGYLAKVWLIASLFLCVPVIPLCFLVMTRIFVSSPYLGESLFGASLPEWIGICLLIPILALTVVVTAYTCSVLAVSAQSTRSASQTAQEAVSFSRRYWKESVLIASAILAINTVVAAPHMLLGIGGPTVEGNLPMGLLIVQQIWMGLTSCVLWPLSIVPFCHLLKSYAAEARDK